MSKVNYFSDNCTCFLSNCSKFLKKHSVFSAIDENSNHKASSTKAKRIISYLFSSIFKNGSVYYQQKKDRQQKLYELPSKDSIPRFLSKGLIDWNAVTSRVASSIISKDLKKIHETQEKVFRCLVVDDSPYARNRSKKVELTCKNYDHATHTYYTGYRMLTLLYTDGKTSLPLGSCCMSSTDESKIFAQDSFNNDLRGSSIHKVARKQMNEAMLDLVDTAKNQGIKADYFLCDSWFSNPSDIKAVKSKGYDVVAMLKKAKTKFTCEDGSLKKVSDIFRSNCKRRGKSKYLLSVIVTLPNSDIKVKLVFVRNKNNRKDYLVLISTDLNLSEEDIVICYTQRWDIEVFFKNVKSDLNIIKRCRALNYDVITANNAIAFLQYQMLAELHRFNTDNRTLGELFLQLKDESISELFRTALAIIMNLFAQKLAKKYGLSEKIISEFAKNFMMKLPSVTTLISERSA